MHPCAVAFARLRASARARVAPIELSPVESSTCSRQTDQSVYRNVFSPDASHVPINGNRAILPASVLNLSKFPTRRMEGWATCARAFTHASTFTLAYSRITVTDERFVSPKDNRRSVSIIAAISFGKLEGANSFSFSLSFFRDPLPFGKFVICNAIMEQLWNHVN